MWLNSKWKILLSILFALSIFQMQTPVLASQKASSLNETQYQLYLKVGNLLRCPTCTGLSVMESEAGFSIQIRDSLIEQIKEGKSQDQIMAFFQERYGLWIFREPPKSGIHLLAWLGPLAVVIIGGFLIWAMVWRKRKSFSMHGVRSSQEILGEMEQRLEQLRIKGA